MVIGLSVLRTQIPRRLCCSSSTSLRQSLSTYHHGRIRFRHSGQSWFSSTVSQPKADKVTMQQQAPSMITTPKSSKEEEQTLTGPQQAMVYLNEVALTRGERPESQIFVSSILGGMFLSAGASMYILLGGGSSELLSSAPGLHRVMSALIFPIGLSTIVLSGTDLLTSNMMYATLPFASNDPRRSEEQKLYNLAKLFAVSFTGNLVGCVGFAYFSSALFIGTPAMAAFAKGIAVKKTSGTLAATFGKAVAANWLVNVAVFNAATAATTPGKLAVLWLPVTAFVALGLEHCVANMYLLPLGAYCGAEISAYDFWITNMLPAVIGNSVGAAVFVSYFHWKAIMPGNYKHEK